MNETTNTLLQQALAYSRKGWSVHPLRRSLKTPATTKGFKDATTDSQQIFEWWDMWPEANISVATGASDLLVIDVDTKAGKVGEATLSGLESEYGPLPKTFTVQTWSGGRHYYFKMPQNRIGNSASLLGPDVDIRGDGGYVVAPGSHVVEDGKEGRYTVLVDAPVADLPAWVAEKLKKPERTLSSASYEGSEEFQGTPDGLWALVQRRCEEIKAEPVNGRGEPWVNGIALSLSVYVPHQLNEHDLRAALTDAVSHWTDGQERGYLGIEHGLRHIGEAGREKRSWSERPPFTPGPQGLAEAPDAMLPAPDNPMAVARALSAGLTKDGVCTLRHWNGGWLRWAGSRWVEEDDHSLRAQLYPKLEHAVYDRNGTAEPWLPNRKKVADLIEAMEAVNHLNRDVQAPSFLCTVQCAGSVQTTVQGTVQGSKVPLTCTVHSVQGKNGENFPNSVYVACANGLLDVVSKELHPLTPRFFNFVSVPFAYQPDAPTPERWLKFLDSVWGDDRESITALQDWFGYMISGRTDLEKILYIQGPTRSGKGTIERTMTALVGEANRASTTAAKLATDFGLASLIGKTLAVIPDSRVPKENSEIVLERLLSISGGDPVSVSRKYRDDYIGQIPARLVLMSNNLPDFKDPSGALTGRLIILSMTKSFLGKEDPTLKDAITKEMPGILNWALEGLARVERRGHLAEPTSSKEARGIAEEVSSPLKTWAEDNLIFEPTSVISKADLYDLYAKWAGTFAVKDSRFFRELYETGVRCGDGFRSKRGLFEPGKQSPMLRGIGIPGGCGVCGRPTDPAGGYGSEHPLCS